MQNLDRSTLSNWVKYMAHNPDYFSYVFRVPLSEEALERAAVQTFGNSHVLWEPTIKVNKYRHKPQKEPIFDGIKAIAGYMGVSVNRVYFYMRHGSFPAWKEGTKTLAYVGKVRRWAENRQVGRFNGKILET